MDVVAAMQSLHFWNQWTHLNYWRFIYIFISSADKPLDFWRISDKPHGHFYHVSFLCWLVLLMNSIFYLLLNTLINFDFDSWSKTKSTSFGYFVAYAKCQMPNAKCQMPNAIWTLIIVTNPRIDYAPQAYTLTPLLVPSTPTLLGLHKFYKRIIKAKGGGKTEGGSSKAIWDKILLSTYVWIKIK